MKGTDKNDSDSLRSSKSSTPLALEAKSVYLKNQDMLKKIPLNRKQLVYEQDDALLDEKQLRN